jgi:hypothetical protein
MNDPTRISDGEARQAMAAIDRNQDGRCSKI